MPNVINNILLLTEGIISKQIILKYNLALVSRVSTLEECIGTLEVVVTAGRDVDKLALAALGKYCPISKNLWKSITIETCPGLTCLPR